MFQHIYGHDINRRVNKHGYRIAKCGSCGLYSLINPPKDLAPFYPSDYHRRPSRLPDLGIDVAHEAYKVAIVMRHVSSGSILEIGPSVGVFLLAARKAGFAVSAIEMDPGAVQFLREKVGAAVTQSADPAATLAADPVEYDAICLWHSIEHMQRPWELLRMCAARLKHGGVLVIGTPNPESWQANVLGCHWPHWDMPRHLHLLPMAWLTARGVEAGLAHLWTTTTDQNGLDVSAATWVMLGGRFLRALGPRSSLLSRVMLRLSRRLGLLRRDLVEGQGAAYTAVFQRPHA